MHDRLEGTGGSLTFDGAFGNMAHHLMKSSGINSIGNQNTLSQKQHDSNQMNLQAKLANLVKNPQQMSQLLSSINDGNPMSTESKFPVPQQTKQISDVRVPGNMNKLSKLKNLLNTLQSGA